VKSWKYLEEFARFGPRGSASEEERRAAEWLAQKLRQLGYEVELQPFRSPRHTLYLGPAVVMAAELLALWLSARQPALAAALAAAALVPLVGELLATRVNFDWILPKYPSQNVVARPPGGRGAAPDVVISAHYDTQWGSWLFAPFFRRLVRPFFLVAYAGLVAAVLAVALRWALPAAAWVDTLARASAAVLACVGAFLLGSWLTGRAVPGANDNGSGVAVALALAHRWMDEAKSGAPALTPWFVFTGCEETGLRGMRQFLQDAPLKPGTVFINIDNVGGGRLRYFLGEGMLLYQRYDPELIRLAEELSRRRGGEVKPLANWLLPTDGLLPAKQGFRALSFLALTDDNAIPNYHWHTDTIERVERDVVELTEQFVWECLRELEERSRAA